MQATTGHTAAAPRRAAVTFIFVTLMLDVLSMGVVIPVLPKLIAELSNAPPAEAVRMGGWIALTWAIAQFLMTPVKVRSPTASAAGPSYCCR
jgi:DHA1 family tetracycline resistance protein-like MFS transporter